MNTLCGWPLVGVRVKIEVRIKKKEKNILRDRPLVRVRAKIERDALCGISLSRVRAKKRRKHPFWLAYD